jgi:hypothetical protein
MKAQENGVTWVAWNRNFLLTLDKAHEASAVASTERRINGDKNA